MRQSETWKPPSLPLQDRALCPSPAVVCPPPLQNAQEPWQVALGIQVLHLTFFCKAFPLASLEQRNGKTPEGLWEGCRGGRKTRGSPVHTPAQPPTSSQVLGQMLMKTGHSAALGYQHCPPHPHLRQKAGMQKRRKDAPSPRRSLRLSLQTRLPLGCLLGRTHVHILEPQRPLPFGPLQL